MTVGYDTLNIGLKRVHCQDTDLLRTVPKYLNSIICEGRNQSGNFISGYLDSLKVNIYENGVYIKEGSLCKYHLGDSFKTLTRYDTREAIERISDNLHLPIHLANVTRIDFAQNIVMEHPENIYYSYLGEAPYYKRVMLNNGVYYKSGKRTNLFYGKVQEQKLKKHPIPIYYKNKHVLRYESRYTSQLPKQFNLPEITAGLLYNEIFYWELIKRWENEYLSIQKVKSKVNTMKATGSKKQFIEDLALFTILEVGQAPILGKVKEWQATGGITKKQAFELRQYLKQVSNIPAKESSNEFINELTRKIKEEARYN